MFNVGRICFKIAGRDANKYCVIINEIDSNFVMIDGQTRRRKCNINHLEPLDKVIQIKKDASNKDVAKALSDAGFATAEKKESKKEKTQKPVKKREIITKVTGEEVKKKADSKKDEKPKKASAPKKPVKK